MKKILAAVVLVGFLLSFILASPFKKDMHFNGTSYSHIKKMSGGEITNHFYTPNGEELNTAHDFIQILEISDKISQDDWSNRFQPLYNQYSLKHFQDKEFELTGSGKKAGIFFNSYATKITVEGKEHMVLYINSSKAEQDEGSEPQKIDMIAELQSIRFN